MVALEYADDVIMMMYFLKRIFSVKTVPLHLLYRSEEDSESTDPSVSSD